jgi:F-type H+-transporting ATPase subunit b
VIGAVFFKEPIHTAKKTMELLTPGLGLIFWQTIIFLGLVFLLGKLAWKPILSSLKERETSIQEAIDTAEKTKAEMAAMKAENENLLAEARKVRDAMLLDAKKAGDEMIAEAKAKAASEGARMLENAKNEIELNKKAAIAEIKNMVTTLSVEIAEKIIQQKLGNDAAQHKLIEDFIAQKNILN